MASYSDDFNRPDSTDIGNWVKQAGDWSIAGNQLAPSTSLLSVARYVSPLDTADHYIEMVMAVGPSGSMGVIARSSSDGGGYYLWRANGSDWTLFRQGGGTFTSIGSWAGSFTNGTVARLECIGTTINGYVNGTLRVSVEEAVPPAGRVYVGVRCNASSTTRYDNFAASDISPVTDSDSGAFFDFL